MMRDAAVIWVRANCNVPTAQSDIIHWLDVAVSMRRNGAFGIGAGLTPKHVPYLLNWCAGELFIFELESRQAAALGLHDNEVARLIDSVEARQGPPFPPLMSLERVEIQTPVITNHAQPIVCTCEYRLLRDPMEIVSLMKQMGLAPGGAVDMPDAWFDSQFGFPGAPQLPPGMSSMPGYPRQQPRGPSPHHPYMAHQPHGFPPHQPHGYQASKPHQHPGDAQDPFGKIDPMHPSFFDHGVAYAFQMQFAIPNGLRTLIAYPQQYLTSSGKLTLAFTSDDAFVGVKPITAAFVSCCNRPPSSSTVPRSPLSNPLAVLLEISPSMRTARTTDGKTGA